MFRFNRPYHEPLQVSFRNALVTSYVAKVVATVIIVLLGAMLVLFFLFASTYFPEFGSTAAGFIGVFVGAGISALVSIALQSDQFKAQALRSKKERIYRPLYEELVALATALQENPYPWQIGFRLIHDEDISESYPSFSIWSEISSDGRRIDVPDWLTKAFDSFLKELSEYNDSYDKCSEFVELALCNNLIQQGFIKEAKGFSAFSGVLRNDFEETSTAGFITMKFVDKDAMRDYEKKASQLIPELFRKYSQADCVNELRILYQFSILVHLHWLTREIKKILKYIDIKYESQDRYL
ncbi:MAG: hypothetical protein Q8L41_12530 [Anaerolineales bacterium]|nr:hypothetical protein [Anaerolineales bacterium]